MERRLIDGEKVVLGKDGTSTSDGKLSDSIPMGGGSISDIVILIVFVGPLECAKVLVNRKDSLHAEMPVAHTGGIFGESEVNE